MLLLLHPELTRRALNEASFDFQVTAPVFTREVLRLETCDSWKRNSCVRASHQ